MPRARFGTLAGIPLLADGSLPPLAGADGSTDLPPATTDVQPPEGQGAPAAESAVQPDQGQGQQDASTGLYDLSTVPQEYRSHVERIAKDIDRNVQQKFTEAAEFRKGWEPFEELGLRGYDPAAIRSLLEFGEVLNDDDSARSAVTRLAEELGLKVSAGDEGEAAATVEADEPDDELAALRKQVEELTGWKQESDQSREYQATLEALESEYAEVEAQHGKPFSESEKANLMKLADRFVADDEPIKAAYAVINEISGAAERELVTRKVTEPRPAEPAGRSSAAVPEVDSFDDAQRLFTERRRQSAATT